MTYLLQFAPDGIHFQTQKTVRKSEAWYAWMTSLEVTTARYTIPNCQFRVVNKETGKVLVQEGGPE